MAYSRQFGTCALAHDNVKPSSAPNEYQKNLDGARCRSSEGVPLLHLPPMLHSQLQPCSRCVALHRYVCPLILLAWYLHLLWVLVKQADIGGAGRSGCGYSLFIIACLPPTLKTTVPGTRVVFFDNCITIITTILVISIIIVYLVLMTHIFFIQGTSTIVQFSCFFTMLYNFCTGTTVPCSRVCLATTVPCSGVCLAIQLYKSQS